jgi:hypothetical protein
MSYMTIGIAVTFTVALPTNSHACSKAYLIGIHDARHVHFLGVARGDTIAAGAGDVKYRIDRGHFGRGTNRTIYGQLVDVEKLGSRRPGALQARGNAVSQAILVPWDYAADCNPVPWSQTSRWIPPDTRGLFEGALRDSTYWIDGIPTVDVHTPEATPYPLVIERGGLLMGAGTGTSPDLTAEQLLGLYDMLPSSQELASDAEGALAPLWQWRQDHAEESYRFPAHSIIQHVLWTAGHYRQSPVAGTYRLTISLPSKDSLVFFARTGRRPQSNFEVVTDSTREGRRTRGALPGAIGYYLSARVAASLRELPQTAAGYNDPLGESQEHVAVTEVPAIDTPDSTVWQGSFDLITHAARLAPRRALREAIETAASEHWTQLITDQRTLAPGYFVRRRDGSMRYTMTASSGDRLVVTVRGERVSLDHLSDR